MASRAITIQILPWASAIVIVFTTLGSKVGRHSKGVFDVWPFLRLNTLLISPTPRKPLKEVSLSKRSFIAKRTYQRPTVDYHHLGSLPYHFNGVDFLALASFCLAYSFRPVK